MDRGYVIYSGKYPVVKTKTRKTIFTIHIHRLQFLEVALFHAYVVNPGNLNTTYAAQPRKRSDTAINAHISKVESS